MKRTLVLIAAASFAAAPCFAKEDAAPASRNVLVAWEAGKAPAGKEGRAGSLVSWEEARSAQAAAIAPPAARPIPFLGAGSMPSHQFDVEEYPLPAKGAAPSPALTRVVPVNAVFAPSTEPSSSSSRYGLAPYPKSRDSEDASQ